MPKKENKKNDVDKLDNTEDFIEEDSYEEKSQLPDDDFDGVIKKLKEQLKNCKSERQEFLDGWQRSKADYVNLKRRSEDEKKSIRDYGTEGLICDFISVIDNFEMAFKDEAAWNSAPENWRSGIKFIYNQILKIFETHGVKQDDPIGQIFNPNIHNSVEVVVVSNKEEDGKILQVQQKGYLLKDRPIRPASVIVAKYND